MKVLQRRASRSTPNKTKGSFCTVTASWLMTRRRSLRYRRMQMRHQCSGAVAQALQGNRRDRSKSYLRISQHETASCTQTERAKGIWLKNHRYRCWVASRAWRRFRTLLKWRRRTCPRKKMKKTLLTMLAISWELKVTKDKMWSKKMDHRQPHHKINTKQIRRILPSKESIKILINKILLKMVENAPEILQVRSSYLSVSISNSSLKTINTSKVMSSGLHRAELMKSRSGRPLTAALSSKREWTLQRQTSKLARRRAGWGCSARFLSTMRTFWQTTLNNNPRKLSTRKNCRRKIPSRA